MTGQARPAPSPAVIAVVIHDDRALLVRRANPPDAGLWGFPGGKIDYGETVAAAALRELQEETGVQAEAREIITALDIFDHDDSGRLLYHYILLAVRCEYVSGVPEAGDDALEARWIPITELDPRRLPMSADVDVIARRAHQMKA
ncbi:NUDIX hydrolase [Microvirga rosea]|uniref:NUDIX hydrolase n=1 Tax=Microvirga rosea TaxID=2715425 RepID=UPI001D0B7D6F|nr:NUDIX hydrolase [Microvirga rosea]MCB8820497.1 NUDIX hydrolase [Microvirga rosea]